MIAQRHGWMGHGARRLATLALSLLAFEVASELGGNPFVSAFVGGLTFGAMVGDANTECVELTELGGSLLSLILWFIFGAAFVVPAFEHISIRIVVYAVCSLTVVRMIPVALAFLGAGLDRATVAFIGWFGPAAWRPSCSRCSRWRTSATAIHVSSPRSTPSRSRSCSASSPTD